MRFTQYTNQTGRSCACKRWHAGIGAASILRFDFLDTQRLGLMNFTQTAAAESQAAIICGGFCHFHRSNMRTSEHTIALIVKMQSSRVILCGCT